MEVGIEDLVDADETGEDDEISLDPEAVPGEIPKSDDDTSEVAIIHNPPFRDDGKGGTVPSDTEYIFVKNKKKGKLIGKIGKK